MSNLDPGLWDGIKGVLFDKDGTLLDFTKTWMPAYRAGALFAAGEDPDKATRMLSATGLDEGSESFAAGSLLASGTTDKIVAAWEPFGTCLPADELVSRLDEVFTDVTEWSSAGFPGVGEALSGLKERGLSVGLATNDCEKSARVSMSCLGLTPSFDFICGYDSGHGAKPGGGMVEAYGSAVGLPPAAIMVVGDNPCDMEMARNAGAGCAVGVLSGNGARKDLEALADIVINGVGDLL